MMKYNSIYERCESARKLEAVLLLTSMVGGITAVFILWNNSLLLSLAVFLLSVVAFGLGRLFDLVAETLSVVGRIEENVKALQTPKAPNVPPPDNPSIPSE